MNNDSTSVNGSDMEIPTIKLHYDKKSGDMIEVQKTEAFLKGPIPISWLNRAARLPGKSINVALAIFWMVGMCKTYQITLSKIALKNFHISADAALDALRRMEEAGLIKLQKSPGKRHLIKVILGNK